MLIRIGLYECIIKNKVCILLDCFSSESSMMTLLCSTHSNCCAKQGTEVRIALSLYASIVDKHTHDWTLCFLYCFFLLICLCGCAVAKHAKTNDRFWFLVVRAYLDWNLEVQWWEHPESGIYIMNCHNASLITQWMTIKCLEMTISCKWPCKCWDGGGPLSRRARSLT